MMPAARLMIAEDEVIVAEDLSRGVRAYGYDVIGCVASGHEALAMARDVIPDLVLMDIVLDGDLNGIAAAQRITDVVDVPVVFITGYATDSLLDAAIRAGADGFVVKPFQRLQVMAAIEMALHRSHGRERVAETDNHTGGSEAGGPVATQKLRNYAQLSGDTRYLADSGEFAAGLGITRREQAIIGGLVRYRRLSTVARLLGISVHTARNHLKSIFRKLDLHSQDDLLCYVLDGERARIS